MPKLRVIRKSHSRREGGRLVVHHPGDTFDGSERLLSVFGDRLERAGESQQDYDVQVVLDANASEAEAMLPELTDDQLDVLSGLETRKGVSKAIVAEFELRAE